MCIRDSTIPPLLDRINVLHVKPKVYALPNVDALGPFRSEYGGLLGMFEEFPGKKNNEGKYFADADDIVKSNKLFRNLYKDKSHSVDAREFVRARLFDIMVGDWSRHEDNWKWAAFIDGEETIYRPIPRDRDMVYSKWDGILPSIADLSLIHI